MAARHAHTRCHRRRTKEFRKFGGPIQLASNAMESLRSLDGELYSEIEGRATWTGNRTNGIKDGIRDEWCASLSGSLKPEPEPEPKPASLSLSLTLTLTPTLTRYAKFDLKSPAQSRGMPYTCVVERPELQESMLRRTLTLTLTLALTLTLTLP